ncbi:DUF2793 domain-containing protein [Rhizobium sp. YIM 134829]|uniref:DUF2793 domain-containing protein n=1 Tax=Rhizobium sp. YIM 134829 TaxID=3390453 RepID=UPI00397A5CEC
MTDVTANLEMPYILPSQAQKHVTHNEALQRLDAVTQLVVSETRSAPPANPPEGSCYAVGPSPTGDWVGKAGLIAVRQDGSWLFIAPRRGWSAFFLDIQALQLFNGNAWTPFDAVAGLQRLGINAQATGANRLVVQGEATLLTHEGHGHRLTLNKAAAGDTASLIYQTGYSGRAEMGLAGSDEFAIKISPNGADWLTALTIGAAGQVRTPLRPFARATRNAGIQTPANNALTGFSTLSIANGGMALGASLPGGGQSLVIPVAGAYLVLLRVEVDPAGAFSAAVQVNGATAIATLRGAEGTPAMQSLSTCGLALLQAGDTLAIRHTGSASIDFGADKTELMVLML